MKYWYGDLDASIFILFELPDFFDFELLDDFLVDEGFLRPEALLTVSEKISLASGMKQGSMK